MPSTVNSLAWPYSRSYATDPNILNELEARKARRPLSPHITIYQPQLTWLMSIGHRVTGASLATALYAFGLYYGLASPGVVTEQLAEVVANAPGVLVGLGKMSLAWPFWYHTLNGVRHLVWDVGRGLSLKATYASGWAVNVLSVVATIASAQV